MKPFWKTPLNRLLRLRGVLLVLAATMLLLTGLASRSEWFVSLYEMQVYPVLTNPLMRLTGIIPVSLAECCIGSGILALLAYGTLQAVRFVRARSVRKRIVGQTLGTLAGAVGLVALSGYWFWGLNYARPDLPTRLGWVQPGTGTSAKDTHARLVSLTAEAVELANRDYVRTFAVRDWGGPSKLSLSIRDTQQALEGGFTRVWTLLGLVPESRLGPASVKPIAWSSLLSRFGISGFYFPWTAEANYNRLTPDVEQAHSIAHEMAHSKGITSEDEASFVGFLALVHSGNEYLRYSGHLFAQGQLLRELSRTDRERAQQIAATRLPGVERDLAAIEEFWRRYEGRAMQIGAKVNDAYLNVHGVEGGIDSYSRSARLLILFSDQGHDLRALE